MNLLYERRLLSFLLILGNGEYEKAPYTMKYEAFEGE